MITNGHESSINTFLKSAIDKTAVIVSDGLSSHTNVKSYFAEHKSFVETNPKEVVRNELPWVHIVIGECRNGIATIHKDIDKRFLQLYLNEYCWKFNRRFFRDSTDPKYLFDRLVKIAALYTSLLHDVQ